MLNRKITALHPIRTPMKHEKEAMQRNKKKELDKPTTTRQISRRERKLALERDVDKLKKKLRHEENIHRALERAFTRPLGSLPRLPPYLPSYIRELVAEVAVLEEEVASFEDQVVFLRKGLYQEAVCIASSNRDVDNSSDLYYPRLSTRRDEPKKIPRKGRRSLSFDVKFQTGNANGKESCQSLINKQQSSKSKPIRTSTKKPSFENNQINKYSDPQKLKLECRASHQELTEVSTLLQDNKNLGDNCPNAISENIIKCLMTILLRMRRTKSKSIVEELSSLSSGVDSKKLEVQDPYGVCSELRRDVGPYKDLCRIDASSINPTRKTSVLFLLDRLKILIEKLAAVKLEDLTHQEKLAFWINVYNSCMMQAFIEHGIPESPESVVALMQKVRVYTASQVESELEVAKKEYLQAAVGISKTRKLIIPKILDWYLLDFAKDLESLLDWICLQLPIELQKDAIKCLDRAKDESLSQRVQVMPYDFSFRLRENEYYSAYSEPPMRLKQSSVSLSISISIKPQRQLMTIIEKKS
ncbi:hypothetical protein V2J09_017095 [Rumex salicifolius]